MDFVSAHMSIEVDGGFKCPFCGRRVDRVNILFPGVRGCLDGLLVGFGCCDVADDAGWLLPLDTSISKATLPQVLDVIIDKINDRHKAAEQVSE